MLPRSPKTQFLCPAPPPGGPQSQELQATCCLVGRRHLGEERARLDCAQLQGKFSVSRACPMHVCGGVPHTRCPLPTVAPTPTSDPPTPALGSP